MFERQCLYCITSWKLGVFVWISFKYSLDYFKWLYFWCQLTSIKGEGTPLPQASKAPTSMCPTQKLIILATGLMKWNEVLDTSSQVAYRMIFLGQIWTVIPGKSVEYRPNLDDKLLLLLLRPDLSLNLWLLHLCYYLLFTAYLLGLQDL